MIKQGNAKAQELYNAGYVLYNGRWITRDDMKRIDEGERQQSSQQAENSSIRVNYLLSNCKPSSNEAKNGWYNATYVDNSIGEVSITVKFKKNLLRKIYFPKQYQGFHFSGLNIPYDKLGYSNVSLFRYSPRQGYIFYCTLDKVK
jgi:hypothetical protein